MAFNDDEEILQDFLVEAGEILERLNEELVDLENRPDDNELLNAVFRSFHTIKGGASFLSLTSIVDVCHRSEDVFNLLRNNELQVDARLMDTMLPVLDVLNSQFETLNQGVEPEAADAGLLKSLEEIIASVAAGGAQQAATDLQPAASQQQTETVSPQRDEVDAEFEMIAGDADNASSISSEEITDAEFEALLDQLHGAGAPKPVAPATVSAPKQNVANNQGGDVISDEEFEGLLDQIHGGAAPGGMPGATPGATSGATPVENKAAKQEKIQVQTKAANNNSEEITDDEFEAMLDQIHGEAAPGKAKPDTTPKTTAKKPDSAKPAAKTAAKPAAKKDNQPQAETTVRVDTSKLDVIMNLVGELVLVRNRMSRLEESYQDEELEKVVSNFDLVTTDLQAAVMKTRMQPIKKVFGRFPRVIRDLARSLNKKVNLELIGEETDLDKNLVEALADPLVHLVRNSVDHGIELPGERVKKGKEEHGTVVLGARQEGDHISLTIEDDGAGMDAEKLKSIAISKGLIDEEAAKRMTDKEAFSLIFMAGFSTKEEISDISGRGVGMDVVKNSIAQLNGAIDIDSEIGKGSKLTIKVPLTLAIMPTLMIMLKEQIFALPLVNVGEIMNLDLQQTNMIDGQQVIMLRERALPIFYLRKWLVNGASGDEMPANGHVVIVTIGTQQVGFVVDQLVGQEEVVIKPLGSTLSGTRGLAGATITGDGKIALILDVPELLKAYAGRF